MPVRPVRPVRPLFLAVLFAAACANDKAADDTAFVDEVEVEVYSFTLENPEVKILGQSVGDYLGYWQPSFGDVGNGDYSGVAGLGTVNFFAGG
jgi:hypothetical protein